MNVKRLVSCATLLTIVTIVGVQPAFAETCPLGSDDLVSTAIGAPMELMPFEGVATLSDSIVTCIFWGDLPMLLMSRFTRLAEPADGPGLSPRILEFVKNPGEETSDTSMAGVGDAAVWSVSSATVLGSPKIPFLFVRRGEDVFAFGLEDEDAARQQQRSIALAKAVLSNAAP